MGKILLPRISTTDRLTITPDASEMVYDTDLNKFFYGDGSTVGGVAFGSGGGSMVYPGAGIPLSTGSAWGTSITNNSANWNTAYGWGNWASNFGTTAGTIAQGNDSRINNGQTAYGWGNPSGVYLPIAGTAVDSSKLGGQSPAYYYQASNPSGFITSAAVGTWGALNYPTWASGTPFVKMTAAGTFALDTNTYLTSLSGALLASGATTGATAGVQTFTNTLLISALTASQLIATDSSKNLVSLAVATYPSLTEISYVKGVTSGIQSQLNGKIPALTTPAANLLVGWDNTDSAYKGIIIGTGLTYTHSTHTLSSSGGGGSPGGTTGQIQYNTGSAFGGNGAIGNATDQNIILGYGTPAVGSNYSNTILGYSAGHSATGAGASVIIGGVAGYSAIDIANSVVIGTGAGYNLTHGNTNTIIGASAGNDLTTESGNTFLGYQSGVTGTNVDHSTFLGAYSGGGVSNLSYTTAIGYGATPTQSSQVVIGGPQIYGSGQENWFTINPTINNTMGNSRFLFNSPTDDNVSLIQGKLGEDTSAFGVFNCYGGSSTVIDIVAPADAGSYADESAGNYNSQSLTYTYWSYYTLNGVTTYNPTPGGTVVADMSGNNFQVQLAWSIAFDGQAQATGYIIQSSNGYYLNTTSLTAVDDGTGSGWTGGTFTPPAQTGYAPGTLVQYYIFGAANAPDGTTVYSASAIWPTATSSQQFVVSFSGYEFDLYPSMTTPIFTIIGTVDYATFWWETVAGTNTANHITGGIFYDSSSWVGGAYSGSWTSGAWGGYSIITPYTMPNNLVNLYNAAGTSVFKVDSATGAISFPQGLPTSDPANGKHTLWNNGGYVMLGT